MVNFYFWTKIELFCNFSENEKLNKRKKILFESTNGSDEASLMDIWNRNLNEEIKSRKEFYGRMTYPNQIAQLYTHLKLDEGLPVKTSR